MGKFREMKQDAIEGGKEKGDAGIAAGEKRVTELRAVKSMIDSAYFQDDIDREQYRMLSEQYYQAGVDAYRRETESVVESAKEDLELNRNEIKAERMNVENEIEKVGDMRRTTDLAQSEVFTVEKNLEGSVSEYQDMEDETEDIEADHEQKSRDIRNRISSIFG